MGINSEIVWWTLKSAWIWFVENRYEICSALLVTYLLAATAEGWVK